MPEDTKVAETPKEEVKVSEEAPLIENPREALESAIISENETPTPEEETPEPKKDEVKPD